MPVLLWDASALAKRYTEETGSATVQALFDAVPMSQMITTIWGYAETFSILLRRRNQGVISARAFVEASSALKRELIDGPEFKILTVDDTAVLAGIDLMLKHNLNATDAAILAMFLRVRRALIADFLILVAADQRLMRASQHEGLTIIEPERFTVDDVAKLLSNV